MKHVITNFDGDPNLGLFGFATDKYVLTGVRRKKSLQKMQNALDVRHVHTMMLNTEFAGIFCNGNSNGIVVAKIMEEHELPEIRKVIDKILVLKTDFSAVGNLILMNDNGIVLSPLIKSHAATIKKFSGLPCETMTIARSHIVGSAGIATNKGCIVHPRTSDEEKRIIKDVLGVEVDIGTVNFGSPFPGSGVIANSNGFIASEGTSGPELGRITEALGFL